MKSRQRDWYGTLSLGAFWITLFWWTFAAVYHASKPHGSDPGIFVFIIIGIVSPACLNLIGLILGVMGLSSLAVKSHKRSFRGTILNLGVAILAVPVLMMMLQNIN
ncbi:hypothetical protein MTYM_02118 [Methylococcales bacterium]|nr:hypothetical protein MTYM_02118 [Methylococcales bacterium]